MDKVDAGPGGDSSAARSLGLLGAQTGGTPVVSSSEFVSDKYNMKHSHRGLAVIINNKNFEKRVNMTQRVGTDVDATAMYEMLSILGFEKILVHHDCKVSEMKSILRKAAKEDHSENDCFICVILTHGEEGYVFGTDDKMSIDDLVAPFKGDKCTSLAGKPKIFFIQACRGTKLDAGVTESDAVSDGIESDEVEQRRIPTEADFLLAYSVVPGFFAWRNSARGSWFIQAIVDVFNREWRMTDLLTMMTRVNKKVAYDFESNASQEFMTRKKQIPCVTSMLTKDVFFYSNSK